MHSGKSWSIWRKIGFAIALPFIVLILLPYAIVADKVEDWWRRRKDR